MVGFGFFLGFKRIRPKRGFHFAYADLATERRAERILDLRPEPIRVDQGQRNGAEDQHAEHDRGRADEQTFHANLPSPIRENGLRCNTNGMPRSK
jgi:hypothetical protein